MYGAYYMTSHILTRKDQGLSCQKFSVTTKRINEVVQNNLLQNIIFFQISDEWTHLEFTQEKKWIWSCLLFFMCYTGMHEVMWSWFEDGILHSNILHNRYSWVQEKGKEGKANRSFHETCFFKEKKRPLERFLFYGMSK